MAQRGRDSWCRRAEDAADGTEATVGTIGEGRPGRDRSGDAHCELDPSEARDEGDEEMRGASLTDIARWNQMVSTRI